LCRERGLSKIYLTCNKHNDNTLAIYDHLGFKITDEQVADIGNGFVMDDYILTYAISK
ncbi:MAG: GNAT family N-acetyltransferase, partial [[Clostridium] scindens]